jgi:malate synthase
MEVFNRYMPNANQKDKLREDVNIVAADLLKVPTDGSITEAGVRNNVSAALHYMAAWLAGNGCVPINNLMEDAATAEIARAQVWQWVRYPKGVLNDGRKVTAEFVRQVIQEELASIRAQVGEQHHEAAHYALAAELMDQIATSETFEDFLTLVAYEHLP